MRRSQLTSASLRRGLFALLRSEAGIALPTALTTTALALGLGSVAAVSAISAQSGSTRDTDVKLSIAAADAGAERAIYRYNKVTTTSSAPCLTAAPGGTTALDADGWCPPMSGSVNDATYEYRVRPTTFVDSFGESRTRLEVVSKGTSDEVGRTIEVNAVNRSGRVFGEFSVIADEALTMNTDALVSADVASNNSITQFNNAQICGVVQVPADGSFTGNQCPGYGTTEGTIDLPPVDQGNVTTVNSNGRFFTQDIRNPANKVSYDAATRTLRLDANSSLTLGGSNYSLCRIQMSNNTRLIIAQGAQVRVYFDAPENCPGLPTVNGAAVQMDLSSSSQIVPTSGQSSDAAFLVVGSDTISTRLILNSSTSICSDFIIYAPRSTVDMNQNSHFCGAIAAENINMNNITSITSTTSSEHFALPVPLHFLVDRYVECGPQPPTGGQPDASC